MCDIDNQRIENAVVAFVKVSQYRELIIWSKKNKPKNEQAEGRTDFWMNTTRCLRLCSFCLVSSSYTPYNANQSKLQVATPLFPIYTTANPTFLQPAD